MNFLQDVTRTCLSTLRHRREQKEFDRVSETEVSNLLVRHGPWKSGERLAEPSVVWPASREEYERMALKLLRAVQVGKGRGFRARLRMQPEEEKHAGPLIGVSFSDSEVYRVRAYYGNLFSQPLTSTLVQNTDLTRRLHRSPFAPKLLELILAVLSELVERLEEEGLEHLVQVVLKGSRPLAIIANEAIHRLGSFPREAAAALVTDINEVFGGSDVDVDVLIDPCLDKRDFLRIHRHVERLVAQSVANLKLRIDSKHFDFGPSSRPRRSFTMQRLFQQLRQSVDPPGPGRPGLENLLLFAELDRFDPSDKAKRFEETPVYVSYNQLRFLNGDRPVSFSLFRCMVSFVGAEPHPTRLHAEILDVSIPYQHESQLQHKWDTMLPGRVQIPGSPGLSTVSLKALFSETLRSLTNNQTHKVHLRKRRLQVLRRLLCSLEDATLLDADAARLFEGVDLASFEDECKRRMDVEFGPCVELPGLGKRELARRVLALAGWAEGHHQQHRWVGEIPKATLCDVIAVVRARGDLAAVDVRALLRDIDTAYKLAKNRGFILWRMLRSDVYDHAARVVGGLVAHQPQVPRITPFQ